MKSRHSFYANVFRAILTLIFMLPLFAPNFTVKAVSLQEDVSDTVTSTELLQFTSSGYVLGFEKEGIYLATGSYMLREEFLGSDNVIPVADQAQNTDDQPQPLGVVTYPNLWDGITLTYDNPSDGIIRSTFQVEAGADPNQIALRYNVPIELDESGNLVFSFETDILTASAPIAWQEIEGKRVPVDVVFNIHSSSSIVGFSLGSYDPAYMLKIDPTIAWNTFLGSANSDEGNAIAADTSGNIYVTGNSDAGWGSPVTAHAGNGNSDAFVAKLDSNGNLLWNTFMGSLGYDYGNAIAVDGSGNVYVTGYSLGSWGTTPVNTYAGSTDIFIAKLDNTGNLIWHTFLGSLSSDQGESIVLDTSGNVYITGQSWNTWGSPVNNHAGIGDAVVAKLNNNGNLQWHTFMGSTTGADGGKAIEVDQSSGDIYITGYSNLTWGAPINVHASSGLAYDGFAAKLNNSGVRQWNTFMGSSSWDASYAIIQSGNYLYVAGSSDDDWGTPVLSHHGDRDAFVLSLDLNGIRQWNTFLGSANTDNGFGISVDENGDVHIAGESDANWGSPENAHAGGWDAFSARLNSSGVRQWHTFMGSSAEDRVGGIAVFNSDNIYVAGWSDATWHTPLNAHAGGHDAFVARFGPVPEIDVQRPAGTLITDGGTDDIGLQAVGTVNLTYTVENTGAANLTVNSPSVSNPNNIANFSVTSSPSGSVSGGSSTTFSIQFDIVATGVFDFDMDIVNNDSNENPYDIHIQGNGVAGTMIINEVDADTPGADTAEFIELYDGGVGDTDLDGLVVVLYNGADDQSYRSIDLNGYASDANGYFIIGNPAVSNVNLTFSNGTLQNGADAVALYIGDSTDFPNDTPLTTNNLLDAIVYDTNDANDGGLLPLLNAGQPQVNEGGNGNQITESNQRCPNGTGVQRNTNTYEQYLPSPGESNCQQEIDVQRPAGTLISDGDTDDIGTQLVGTVNLTYTVKNSGGTDLTLSSPIASTLNNISSFSVTTPPSSPVAGGGTTTFTIQFNVDAAGSFSFDMDIANNDSDESTYDIEISGTTPLPTLSVSDVIVTEGDSGTASANFTVTLSPASSQTVTVDYATADVTATAPGDYTGISTTTLTFTPGQTSKTISVDVIGDTLDENSETFTVNLSNPANATISDASGIGTIIDDDSATISISDAIVTEGDSGTASANFTVTLSPASSQTVTVDYATADVTATAPGDYTGISTTTLTFTPGQTSKTISVDVIGDTLDENSETFTVNLSNPANATISDASGIGTITDDDAQPTLTISDESEAENVGLMSFDLSLSSISALDITLDYATADDTAVAPGDYTQDVGSITIPAGSLNAIIDIAILTDGLDEGNEQFSIELSNLINAVFFNNNSSGIGTILENSAPTLLFDANTVPENNATLFTGLGQILISFSEDVKSDSSSGAANTIANYILLEANGDDFQTVNCATGVNPNDAEFVINTAIYNNNTGAGPFIATLNINNGVPLPAGIYRLYVCGTTSIEDLTDVKLNNGLSDSHLDFVISQVSSLPATGFPRGHITSLSQQPPAKAYTETAMMLNIPILGVNIPIVGVPQTENGWDVNWLGNNAGYLAGSAYPTWAGNTVITGHVWDAFNRPGAFSQIKSLKYGDQVQIRAWGLVYTYEVRDTRIISPQNIDAALAHEEYDWATLVTCEDYNTVWGNYDYRRMVQAVLVSVK